MGIDIDIYYESSDGAEPTDLMLPPAFGKIEPAEYEEARNAGATHRIYTLVRWYGIGYERGYWPQICGVLMGLMASANVKRVWYFGDSQSIEDAEPLSIKKILALSEYYMLNGERPYRKDATPIQCSIIN